MADDDNSHPPRDWGHCKSPFFKLPPEIRNKIYRETFAGSKINLTLDPPLNVRVVPATGRRSIFSTVNPKHYFLLTCFQVYCEAIAIYWSLTVVDNGYDRHYSRWCFSRGYFLNRIPAIARPYIQHLRNVSVEACSPSAHKWLQDQAIGWHLSIMESLSSFPNLKSCSVHQWYEDQGLFVAQHVNVPILGTYLVDYTWYGSMPIKSFSFTNLTSGKNLTWSQPSAQPQWLSDEDAFAMVMNPAPNEIESTKIHFDSITKDLFGEDFMDKLF